MADRPSAGAGTSPPRPAPLDPPLLPYALAGTAAWAVAALVLTLTGAPTGWRWTCLAGVLVGCGLVAVGWLRRRYAHRRAERAARYPSGSTSVSS